MEVNSTIIARGSPQGSQLSCMVHIPSFDVFVLYIQIQGELQRPTGHCGENQNSLEKTPLALFFAASFICPDQHWACGSEPYMIRELTALFRA